MFKKNLKFVLSLAIMSAVIVSSCKKKEGDIEPAYNAKGASSSFLAGTGCDTCNTNTTGITIDGTARTFGDISADPEDFAPVYFNFIDGVTTSGNAHVEFSNQFNSFVTGQNGWNISYLDTVNVPYSTIFDNIGCSTVEDYIKSTGVVGNSLGANGTSSVKGWYNYHPVFRTITPTTVIVVWKDCDNNGLDNGDIVYVVKLAVTYTPGPPYTASTVITPKINIKWKCVPINCI